MTPAVPGVRRDARAQRSEVGSSITKTKKKPTRRHLRPPAGLTEPSNEDPSSPPTERPPTDGVAGRVFEPTPYESPVFSSANSHPSLAISWQPALPNGAPSSEGFLSIFGSTMGNTQGWGGRKRAPGRSVTPEVADSRFWEASPRRKGTAGSSPVAPALTSRDRLWRAR